jgi:hypothetical protein
MKKLLFVMMAILLVNMSYAAELGEDQKGDCINSPNHSRGQEVLVDDAQTSTQQESDQGVISE